MLLYQEQSSASDNKQQIYGALITGAIVLVGVLVATTAFILLYKYRCLKVRFFNFFVCVKKAMLGF